MTEIKNGNGTKWLYKEEVKFWIIIITIIASVICNYYTLKQQIVMNDYRISQIEKDRSDKWIEQKKLTEKQMAVLDQMQKDINTLLISKKQTP